MLVTRAFVAAVLSVLVSAVDTADTKGIAFVDTATNKRLQIIGVDYQPGGQASFDPSTGKDVLSDSSVCLRDAVIMQQLGVNTIRVYNVNPQTNHDACMSIFNAAGIYVIVDVNSPFMSLNRADPASSYNSAYLTYIFGQVENFKGYPNTLAFFAGNEVINDIPTAGSNPPYIRAIQRDLRQYIAKQSTRHIPVGYSAADVREVLTDTWNYLTCAINGDANDITRGELFGLNSYSWCGAAATFQSAGYNTLVSDFQSTSVPVFFSEYGCNLPAGVPRVFNEVQALYGPNMTDFNGGLVYEYSQETSNYGLVTINSDGSVQLLKDFDNLQGQYNKIDKNLVTTLPSTNPAPVKCDASLITQQGFNTSWVLPTAPAGTDALIANGISKPQQGKLVDVTSTSVTQKVLSSSGTAITGLALNKQTGSNLPSGATTSSNTSQSGGSSSSSGKKGAASSAYGISGGVIGAAMAAAGLFALL
ncbi:hypothetical protein BT63DRAFT_398665 [Microthyrium microscopicum]|uniref:1,3-beta-glucanosyltransferase n=1 Tax=Microthyrium microscopicum TaxID=703497 RepID=A0A6A6UJG9_9PEZI|nr:hypothetical protein BT63DRAFT_398665 [Microthyrium microscopicum]